ncbi:MAG: hypothetical protein NTY46_06545 [Candidatus Sumerlaeota bacterium]|nr:hypothetical protein [Candidatus Sumerlaeota bacterium]
MPMQQSVRTEIRFAALALAIAGAIVTVLYWRTLNAFFIFDDLSIIALVSPQFGKGWMDCLLPVSNGFWRPGILLPAHACLRVFGLCPLPFHLFAIAFHIIACILTGLVAGRAFPLAGGRARWLASLLMAVNAAAFFSAASLSNSCDSFMACGILAGLLAWDAWLTSRSLLSGLFIYIGLLATLMGKETGVIYPIILVLWAVCKGAPWGAYARKAAALFLIALAYAAIMAILQMSNKGSYASQGLVRLFGRDPFRQALDYCLSAWWPFIHLIDLPGCAAALPHWALWALRFMTAFGAVALMAMAARRPALRMYAFCAASVVLIVLPPSFLRIPQHGRFVYPAVAMACITVAGLASGPRSGLRFAGMVFALLVCLCSVWSLTMSRAARGYLEISSNVELLVDDLKRIAPNWRRDDGQGVTVLIFDHPHPGEPPWRWVYCQLIFDIFIPQSKAVIVLDAGSAVSVDRVCKFTRNGLSEEPRERRHSQPFPEHQK